MNNVKKVLAKEIIRDAQTHGGVRYWFRQYSSPFAIGAQFWDDYILELDAEATDDKDVYNEFFRVTNPDSSTVNNWGQSGQIQIAAC